MDQWFWSLGKSGASLPRRETVAEYDAATPSDFQFTVKCPNAMTLTHQYARKGEPLIENPGFLDVEYFHRFIESLDALIPKVGLFIFQFEYLNKDKMSSKNRFLDKVGTFIDTLPADFQYAFEIRNPRWVDADWFGLLQEKKVAPVLLQGYWMDDIARTIDTHGSLIKNSERQEGDHLLQRFRSLHCYGQAVLMNMTLQSDSLNEATSVFEKSSPL